MPHLRAAFHRFVSGSLKALAAGAFVAAGLAATPAAAQEVDLFVTKSGPATAAAGSNVAYTVTLSNLGPDNANLVNLTDAIPGGMTFVSATASAGFTCTTPAVGAGGSINCSIAVLPASATATFTFVLQIPPATPPGTSFTNLASATTADFDVNAENDAAPAFTTVPGAALADAGMANSASDVAFAGTDVAFTLTITNAGPDAAANLTLTDPLPASMTFVSLATSGTPLTCATPPAGAGGTITCGSVSFPVSSATLTLVAHVPAATPLGTTFTNTATITTSSTDPNPENDSATATVEIVAAATLTLDKAVVNNSGGVAAATAWTLAASGPTPVSGAKGQPAVTAAMVLPGNYALSESGPAGYTATGPYACVVNGSPLPASNGLTLAQGQTAVCTITNDDNAHVAYDGNGSTGGAVPVDNNSYPPGSTVVVAAAGTLARTGFAFTGWNTAANGSGTARAAGSTFAIGSTNVTLFAQWAPTYTVTYSGNGNTGGTPPVDSTAYPQGATVTVAGAGTLVKAGFTFIGWNTAADGTGTSRAAGSSFAMGAANVTLHAQWTSLPTYTVTYSGNGSTGGTVPVDANAYLAGATVTVLGNTGNLVRAGFTFAGWNTAANGSGTSRAPGSTFAMGAANVTLFASWTAVTAVSGASPTGGGTISASLSSADAGCGFTSAQFIPVTGHAASPPAGTAPTGVSFPFGLFDFTIGGCTAPGASVTVTVTYPGALPATAVYWKYGPTPAAATPSWYVLPATISGNTAVFTIVDGALGDDDRTANGTIVDQGGPGVPPSGPVEYHQTPTLSEWAMLLLALMILGVGMRRSAR